MLFTDPISASLSGDNNNTIEYKIIRLNTVQWLIVGTAILKAFIWAKKSYITLHYIGASSTTYVGKRMLAQ